MAAATLFYLIGPSGAGKDSLLGYARARLAGSSVLFAHRYITRPAGTGGENHIALDPAEFERRQAAELFALHWQSHGRRYGIGIEIDQWLMGGLTVVVSGSRAHLPQALARYPQLVPVWIDVCAEQLYQRLRERARETEAEIAARLERARHYRPPTLARLVIINNDGPLECAGEALIELLHPVWNHLSAVTKL
jgi:ribose 1,5-bisphosphokinase